jgi:3',5'-cyclic AMP phosphodiesterase CpdA
MAFRLVHISDLHLGPLPPVSTRQLVSKRVLGYANWQRNRAMRLQPSYLKQLLDHSKTHKPDHMVITGDLINLGLADEVIHAASFLGDLGVGDKVSVTPGNHDAYVPGALQKACLFWDDYMRSNDAGTIIKHAHHDNHRFPFLRIFDDIALIGLSTAYASGPFMATGRVSKSQRQRLKDVLNVLKQQGLFRIIAMHHPPYPNACSWHKRLMNSNALRHIIADAGAELILHGHTHQSTHHFLTDSHDIDVFGIASASQEPGSHHEPAQYHLITIDKKGSNWQCQIMRYGYDCDDHIKDLSRFDRTYS